MMIDLILFENKKFLKRKKNIITFLFLIAVVFGLLFLNHSMSKALREGRIKEYQGDLISLKESLGFLPESNGENKALEQIFEDTYKEIELIEKQINAYQNRDWKTELSIQVERDQLFLEQLSRGNVIGGEPRVVVNSRINLHQELITRNIEPVNDIYGTQGYNFVKSMLENIMGIIGLGIFLFIVSDIMSSDLEDGTIKLLFTQPLSRKKVVHAKYVVAVVNSIILIVLLSFIAFVVESIFSGTGNLHYPVELLKNEEIIFINLSTYFIQWFLLFIGVIFFAISVAFLISALTNNSMLTVGLTIIILVILNLCVSQFRFLTSIAHILPTSYVNISSIISGLLASNSENSYLTFPCGLIVTLLFGCVNYFITLVLIKRKNIYH